MQKIRKILTALFFFSQAVVAKEQFISLTLCSDRLLIELAHPEQIAAQSPYSKNPLMMLDKLNLNKPTVEPQLIQLLPYLNHTILINEFFYPQLTVELKKLGVKIIPINDSPQTPEQLFELILQLGKLTNNQQRAMQLVNKLTNQNTKLNTVLTDTLIMADTGIIEPNLPQYQTLLTLLGLTPNQGKLTAQNFSLEKLLLSQANRLILLTDKNGYNAQAQWLSHSLLQKIFPKESQASMPLKYGYCFDHGVWQGAELLYQQFQEYLRQ